MSFKEISRLLDSYWDLNQEGRIRDAEGALEQNARNMDAAASSLHAAVERLALLTQALWELARDRTGLTEAELLAKMHEIDLRDGKADGRIERMGPECPKCGKGNKARRVKCFYCGTPLTPPSAFNAL